MKEDAGKDPAHDTAIRVLHVVVSLDAGGMERVLSRVAAALVPRGFEFHVCGLRRRGVLAEHFVTPENVVTLDMPAGRSWGGLWQLHRLIRHCRPQVLHTHNLGPLLYGAPASFFGRLCPILHGEHCQLLCPELGDPRLRLRRILYRACAQLHTVSEESRRELLSLGFGSRKITAVVNGVDSPCGTPMEQHQAREELGLPPNSACIAMVARFEERKRHAMLIEATAELLADGRDVHLLLAGDGSSRSRLESLTCTLKAQARVHFLGFRDDVTTVFRAADIAVLPSTGEGLSNAMLEAMACGTPVLCHSACGCAEVITDGLDGWIRDLDCAKTLATALAALLNAPEKIRMAGAEARRKVAQHFDFHTTVNTYEQLYRELAATGSICKDNSRSRTG